MASTLITDYLGKGLLSARPATPPVASNALAIYFATDIAQLSEYDGSTWRAMSSVWREGAGAPANTLGLDGDLYLNGTTGDVLQRAAGAYSVVCNIRGPAGATGPAGTSGAVGPAGPPGAARNSARMQAQWVTGATVANDTIYLSFDTPYNGMVNGLTYFTGSGSFNVNVQIAGVSVGGLGAVAVNSATPATTPASAPNTFTAGQTIGAVVAGASGSPTDALLSLAVTWS